MRGTNAVLRARIMRLVKKWRPRLDLAAWMIDVRFDEDVDLGTCDAKPAYEKAVIAFQIPLVRDEVSNITELEELVVHELVHCIMWKSSERAVTQVSRVILRAWGVKYESV